MTRDEALRAAEECFNRVTQMRLITNMGAEHNKAFALWAQALAETGKGYVELAKMLNSRVDSLIET